MEYAVPGTTLGCTKEEAFDGKNDEQVKTWKAKIVELVRPAVEISLPAAFNFGRCLGYMAEKSGITKLVFVGAGASTAYPSLVAALLQNYAKTVTVQVFHPQELINHLKPAYTGSDTMYIAFSRSGTSPDTAKAMETIRATTSALTVAVCASETTRVAKACHHKLALGDYRYAAICVGSKFLPLAQAAMVAGFLKARENWEDSDECVRAIKLTMEALPDVKEGCRKEAAMYAHQIHGMADPVICIYGDDYLFAAAVNIAGSLLGERAAIPAAGRRTQDIRHGDGEFISEKTVIFSLTFDRTTVANIELQKAAKFGNATYIALPEIHVDGIEGNEFFKRWCISVLYMAQIETVGEFLAGHGDGLIWDTKITNHSKLSIYSPK